MRHSPNRLPPDVIFTVCERFLTGYEKDGSRITAGTLAKWVNSQGYGIKREAIYRIVRIGIERGFVKLCPPQNQVLRQRLLERFPGAGHVRVYDVKQPNDISTSLAAGAAEVILELIRSVDSELNPAGTPLNKRERVHLGFGGGGTSLKVAKMLAPILRAEDALPPLTIHALSSGFDVSRPLSAPGAFLSMFSELEDVEFVGLFCPPFVEWDRYDEDQSLPGIEQAFTESKNVHIAVSSMAQADDEHGLLNWFFDNYGEDGELARLVEQGHVGDVFWQPYSDTGPLENTSIRAFTLFDIPKLVEMSATAGKHVVVVAGPCIECDSTKERALMPLLTRPELKVFDHLVTDTRTVQALLGHA